MNKIVAQSLGAAGVTYTVASVVYSGSPFVNLGFTEVPSNVIQIILPLVMSVVYPLILNKWPMLIPLIDLFWKPQDKNAKILDLINQLEMEAAKTGCEEDLQACKQLRELTLKRLKNETA